MMEITDALLVVTGSDLLEAEIDTDTLDDMQLCLQVGRAVVDAIKRADSIDGTVVTVTAYAK